MDDYTDPMLLLLSSRKSSRSSSQHT